MTDLIAEAVHKVDCGCTQYEHTPDAQDYYAEVAEAVREALAPHFAVVDAARAWRAMRAGTPTKPKPESAALLAAVDALDHLEESR